LWQACNMVFSFATSTVLFALVFKVIPDVDLTMRDVWIGSFFTAFLFNIGKMLLGYYLATSSMASAYGAAGSLVALVVWVYYSAQILLFGAEFTQAYARRNGQEIPLRSGAVPLPRRRASDRPPPPPKVTAARA
jgi:membrane protein